MTKYHLICVQTWALHYCICITLEQLQHKTAAMKLSTKGAVPAPEYQKTRLFIYSCDRVGFIANQQSTSRLPLLLFCHCFGFASYVKVLFITPSHVIYLIRKHLLPMAIMIVGKSWRARISDYTNYILLWGHQYKHVIARRLEFSIDAEHNSVLIAIRAVVAWRQLWLCKISAITAHHTSVYKFNYIFLASKLRLTSVFVIHSMYTIYKFSETAKVVLGAKSAFPLFNASLHRFEENFYFVL